MLAIEKRINNLKSSCESEIKECNQRIIHLCNNLLQISKTKEQPWDKASSLKKQKEYLEGIIYDLQHKESLSRHLQNILREF